MSAFLHTAFPLDPGPETLRRTWAVCYPWRGEGDRNWDSGQRWRAAKLV